MSPTLIEDELRTAFRAAADRIHPSATPLAPRDGTAETSPRRWLVPAIAAAAVAAITAPVLAVTLLRGASGPDMAAASALTVSAGRATVTGVSFPLPAGWSAKAVGHSRTAVTVCVAARPSATCDGVTLRIAVPDGSGAITPVRDPLATDRSSRILDQTDAPAGADGAAVTATPGEDSAPSSVAPVPRHESTAAAGSTAGVAAAAPPVTSTPDLATETCPLLVDRDPIDGRPAAHYSIGSCAHGSPQSADWYVLDGSLAISTPRGVANQQAAQIVRGWDFSGYHHAFGPQIAFFSDPGEASSSAAAPTR